MRLADGGKQSQIVTLAWEARVRRALPSTNSEPALSPPKGHALPANSIHEQTALAYLVFFRADFGRWCFFPDFFFGAFAATIS